MNSRERVRRFLAGKPVDRIPNGLGGCETAGLHNVAYHKLKKILGVDHTGNRVCTFMNNAIFEPPVLRAMEGDIILLASRMCPSRFWGPDAAREWKRLPIWDIELQVARDWNFLKDADGAWWWDDNAMCPPGAFYFDPPVNSSVGRDFNMADFPSPDTFNPSHELPDSLLRRLEEDARWLYENTDYAISCGEMIHDLQIRPGGTQSRRNAVVVDADGGGAGGMS